MAKDFLVTFVAAKLWNKFSIARYLGVHSILGTMNYVVALGLMLFEFNHHIATAAGHFLHVAIGFFWDRAISFRSPSTLVVFGAPKYIIIEVFSYLSIIAVMVVMIDWWGWNEYLVRVTFAMLVATLVSFALNKYWTFRK